MYQALLEGHLTGKRVCINKTFKRLTLRSMGKQKLFNVTQVALKCMQFDYPRVHLWSLWSSDAFHYAYDPIIRNTRHHFVSVTEREKTVPITRWPVTVERLKCEKRTSWNGSNKDLYELLWKIGTPGNRSAEKLLQYRHLSCPTFPPNLCSPGPRTEKKRPELTRFLPFRLAEEVTILVC